MKAFFHASRLCAGRESHCFHFAQCILFPEKIHFQKGAALRRKKVMNGLVIVLIGIVALGAGYLFYGRWLAKKWGIDPNAKTPAYTHEDGEDYVPSSKFTVFHIIFLPSQVQVLSQVRSLHLFLDGFRYCSGSSSADFSSVLYRTSVLYMHP